MMIAKEKHFIGFGLFSILLIFFYSFKLIVFSIVNESSVLIEFIFLAIYLFMLVLLSIFYLKNRLVIENIILFIFSLVFANPFVLGLFYYPVFIVFDGTSTMELLDKCLYLFTYPFDIFCSNAIYLIELAPIIPLIYFIKIFANKKAK